MNTTSGILRRPPNADSGAAGSAGERRRYYDPILKVNVVQVFQGDFFVSTRDGEMLATVLGSCVAACIRDPVAAVGGMNHFLLPDKGGDNNPDLPFSASLRYGSYSMEQLINGILAAGGRRERLEVKIFGGANVLAGLRGIGHQNADFIERYLKAEGFKVTAADLRGNLPRKVQYFPSSGVARVKQIEDASAKTVFQRETAKKITAVQTQAGSIELFD
ncbi:chemoreceptor glutamine deamidase CheD [Ferrovibrio sp.]|jgi:chemotaxis protein CheD|uniref:chemoreceptor glutamine deamidase CheD n=1 Tax=Ferrovibrio sp. TaxID=1917215 RepID=UPI0035AE95C8